MQVSTLDSYQYSNNTKILCIWAWERCKSSLWKWLQKQNKNKKVLNWCSIKLATTQDRQRLQNSDEKQYWQYWILCLVVFTRFRANRDCLLEFCMLVKSAKRVSREIYWENMSTLGLLHMVSWGCCDNTWLLWKTCLHAVYHRPMA